MSEAQQGKVIGLGGLFMLSPDPEKTLDWYREVLGMLPNDYGGFDFAHSDSAASYPIAARSILATFQSPSEYFAPSTLPFMLNLMVDDLDAILARAEAAGVKPVKPSEDYDYGRFGWLMDPDGRKVELWEPKEPADSDNS